MYENYKRIRDAKGLKDSDVSRETGIPKSTFSDWKNGRSKPKTDKLIKIAKCLDVSVEHLEWDDVAWNPESQDIYLVEKIPPVEKAKIDYLVSTDSTKFGSEILIEMLDTITEIDERHSKELLAFLKAFARMSKED